MDLGDRMKMYERFGTGQCAMPRLPVLVRLDGRCFHGLTKNCTKPFDEGLHEAMVSTAIALAEETCAKVAYTQSDEISLLLYTDKPDAKIYFDGKYHKINSVLAGLASVTFTEQWVNMPMGLFDCRTWTVPTKDEAVNAFVWREQDATRNSVQMAARARFSHKQCYKKNNADLQEMLFQDGVNWNDYADWEKRGTFVIRRKKLRTLTEAERSAIPEKHRPPAHQDVVRTSYETLSLPVLTTIQNRVEVLFKGAEPVLRAETEGE